MNFLFWNIYKKDSFYSSIAEIVKNEEIDVLVLAEFGNHSNTTFLLHSLQAQVRTFTYLNPISTKVPKVEIFYNSKTADIKMKKENKNYSVVTVAVPGKPEAFSAFFCHLPSKVNKDELSLYEHLKDTLMTDLELYEKSAITNDRTIICGDFNMNPFDLGMTSIKGVNAVMDRTIAQKISTKRKISDSWKSFSFFYNPMWSLFGDNGNQRVSGSFYYNPSEYNQIYWEILDQVVIRPSLISLFDSTSLKFIYQSGTIKLLDSTHKVDKNNYSDHLPLKFKFNL